MLCKERKDDTTSHHIFPFWKRGKKNNWQTGKLSLTTHSRCAGTSTATAAVEPGTKEKEMLMLMLMQIPIDVLDVLDRVGVGFGVGSGRI